MPHLPSEALRSRKIVPFLCELVGLPTPYRLPDASATNPYGAPALIPSSDSSTRSVSAAWAAVSDSSNAAIVRTAATNGNILLGIGHSPSDISTDTDQA